MNIRIYSFTKAKCFKLNDTSIVKVDDFSAENLSPAQLETHALDQKNNELQN